MMEIKQEYEKLRKKYNLPGYEELDSEFELLYFQNILEIKYPLRFIRRRIGDKVNWFTGFFQGILNPNPESLVSLEESGFFSKEEKDDLVKLVKEMIVFERENLILDLGHNEKKDAEFIKKGFELWKTYKKNIMRFCEKMREGWKAEFKEDKEEHYFG